MNEDYFYEYFTHNHLLEKVEEIQWGSILIEIKRGKPTRIIEKKGVTLDD